eukprot:363658-Chlamydomonas_euryale.AAC.6
MGPQCMGSEGFGVVDDEKALCDAFYGMCRALCDAFYGMCRALCEVYYDMSRALCEAYYAMSDLELRRMGRCGRDK